MRNKIMLLLSIAFIYGCLEEKGNAQAGCPNVAVTPANDKGVGSMYCGGQGYKTVKIGTQTWMAQNLNYNIPDSMFASMCYGDQESNCKKYGSLYSWSTAMALNDSCNYNSCASQIKAKHQGICPSGWHIPTNADWDQLLRFVDGSKNTGAYYNSKTAGKLLKAKSGWVDDYGKPAGNGTNALGFEALPGGEFSGVHEVWSREIGSLATWWVANETSKNGFAFSRSISSRDNSVYQSQFCNDCGPEDCGCDIGNPKTFRFSVRCVKD